MEVCGITEEHVGRDSLPNVLTVGLDVGSDAGIEVDNLEFCLEVLLSEPPFGMAKPKIARVSGNVLRVTFVEVEDGSSDD